MSNNQEKRKRDADAIPLDQFHEALQQVPLELPDGVSILYSERAVHALRMAHQLFLQVVAAELAQAEVNMLYEGHAVTALSQVGFADLCSRAQAALAAIAETTTTTTAAAAAAATKSSTAFADTSAVSNSEPKKKRKKMVKKVITKEMEEEQARLFQQSVTMQQQKRNEEKLAGSGT